VRLRVHGCINYAQRTRSRHAGTGRNGREEHQSRGGNDALGFTGCTSAGRSRSEDPRSITIHVIDPRRGFVSASVPRLIRADTFFRDRRKRETWPLAGIYGRAARRDARRGERMRMRIRESRRKAQETREWNGISLPMTDRVDGCAPTPCASFERTSQPPRGEKKEETNKRVLADPLDVSRFSARSERAASTKLADKRPISPRYRGANLAREARTQDLR